MRRDLSTDEQGWPRCMPRPEPPEVLDAAGAMRLLRIGSRVLYEQVARGRIPHRRVGKHLRFSRAALLAWLAGNTRDHA